MASFYEFEAAGIDAAEKALSEHAGKVALVVNVASKCGLTPQYEGLERLYNDYRERGFVVLGFPCNQFMGQEPGSEAEISEFCSVNYGVTFPLFSKIEVNGDDRHPAYEFLTSQASEPDGPGDIAWNFAKFLVDGKGQVIARFAPPTDPEAPELKSAIEAALG
jgi:glutathione peroxidase